MRLGLLLSLASALATPRREAKRQRSKLPVAVSLAFGFLAVAGALYLTYAAYEWLRTGLGAPLAALIAGIGALIVAGAVLLIGASGRPRKEPDRLPFDVAAFGAAARSVDRISREHPYAIAASLFALGVLQGLSRDSDRRRGAP